VFFPQQQVRPRERPLALLTGTLVMVEGCLRVTNDFGDNYLIVWPSDVTLSTNSDVIEIHNRSGQIMARVGGEVNFGGGEVSQTVAAQSSRQIRQPAAICLGPYWLAGEIIPP